jgi:hypothetical protein
MCSDLSDQFKNSLESIERETRRLMQDLLAQHLNLNALTINTMTFVIGSSPPTPIQELRQSSKVVMMLLNRMSNDIRTAGLLAWHGYTMQSAALIANCHENAFGVLYVAADDLEAQKWMDHNDPTCMPFGNIKTVTHRGLKNRKVPNVQEQTEKEYTCYRQLCWAKHGNPILQKHHGLRSVGNQIGVFNGPDSSEESIRLASWVLEHAAHLAYLALTSFVDNQLTQISSERRNELVQRIKTLGAKKSEVSEASIKRWGDTDPFPGQWRV